MHACAVHVVQASARYPAARPTGSEVVMPVLTNERHERFCQGIAAGRSQTQAYIEAGFRCEKNRILRNDWPNWGGSEI